MWAAQYRYWKLNSGPLEEQCLSQCSISVKRHRDHSYTSYKGKHLTGASLQLHVTFRGPVHCYHSRKREILNSDWTFWSTKSSDTLPTRPHLLILSNSATLWWLSSQTFELMADILNEATTSNKCSYLFRLYPSLRNKKISSKVSILSSST